MSSTPHLRYLNLSEPNPPNASRDRERLPAHVAAVLRLATPKGTIRESHLSRVELARLIESAGAIVRRAEIGELATGYVWCDDECGVHPDGPDPFGYGEPCPGPHHDVYLDPERDR